MDATDLVLDRVFRGQDVDLGAVDLVQAGIKRGRFAATGGASDQQDAVRAMDQVLHQPTVPLTEADLGDVQQLVGLVQQAHHDPLVFTTGRNGRNAEVDAASGDAQRDAAVLRQALFGDVQPSHDLHAGNHRAHELQRSAPRHVQLAVDSIAHDHFALFRLDVNVAGSLLHGLREQAVHPANDGRVVVRVEDVDLLVVLDLVRFELADRLLTLVDLVDRVDHGVGGGHREHDRLLERRANGVQTVGVERVGTNDLYAVLVVAEH